MNIPFILSLVPHPEIGSALIHYLYYLLIRSQVIIEHIPYCDADFVI